jgi:hypothetical protein
MLHLSAVSKCKQLLVNITQGPMVDCSTQSIAFLKTLEQHVVCSCAYFDRNVLSQLVAAEAGSITNGTRAAPISPKHADIASAFSFYACSSCGIANSTPGTTVRCVCK